jgi:hypothetical protein
MSSDETSDYLNTLAGSGGNKDQSYLDSVDQKGGIVETPTEDYLNTLSTPGSGTGAGNYLNELTVNAGSTSTHYSNSAIHISWCCFVCVTNAVFVIMCKQSVLFADSN